MPDRDGRRWWIGGGAAALVAAAAVIAALLFVGRSDETVTTPATTPTTVPDPTVPDATVPDGTTVPTVPAVVPPTTVAPPTTAPGPVVGGASIATAGPDGVVLRDAALTPIRTLDVPMAIALPMADGRVIVQRVSDPFEEGDHTPLVWALDGSLTELVPDVSWAGPVTLHDVANVDGVPTLLYSVSTDIEDPEAAREQLYARTLDGPNAGTTTLVGDIGGWESGTGRLHLSSNGLIVGEETVRRQQRAAVHDPPGRLRRGHGRRDHAGDVRPRRVVRRLRDLPRRLHRVPGRDDPGVDRERQPRHLSASSAATPTTPPPCHWRGRRRAVTSTCSTTGGS